MIDILGLSHRKHMGDTSARAILIEHYIPTVERISQRLYNRYEDHFRPGVEREDIIQDGLARLVYLVDKHDPTRGKILSQFVPFHLPKAMWRHTIRHYLHITSLPQNTSCETGYELVDGDKPSANITVETIDDAMEAKDGVANTALANLTVQELLQRMRPDNREMVKRWFGIGCPEESHGDIGKSYNMGRAGVSLRIVNEFKRIREQLGIKQQEPYKHLVYRGIIK